jgi:type I restriction enzyme, S subunit
MREMKDSGVEWIGEIPVDWNVGKTLYALSMPITDGPHETPELFDEGIPFISAEAVSCGNGHIDFEHIRGFISQEFYEECCKKYIPQINDIYMIKSGATTGKVAKVETQKLFTIWSPLAVFRVEPQRCYYEYLYYFIQSDAYQKQIENKWTYGTQQNIGMRTLEKLMICFPSITQQKLIADYLDSKCSKIDEIIEKQRAIIEKLKEYKFSIITEAVTKGINPDVELKDSTIDMCEQIPVHWSISQNRYLFSLRDEKNYKPLEEVRLLSLYTDLGVFPHGEQEERGNKAVKAEGYKVVYENDIVVNIILAWMGAIGRSAYDGVTSPAYDIYKPNENVCSRYYHYLYRTKPFSAECYKYGRGIMAMRWRTYSSEFKSIKVPVPPYIEQCQIADYLDSKCEMLDKTITDRNKAIDKLQEYKKSLIYEGVTGKKEV